MGTLQNDRRRRRRIFFHVFQEHLKLLTLCHAPIPRSGTGQVPFSTWNIWEIWGCLCSLSNFEFNDFFRSGLWRCQCQLLPGWPGQVRFNPPGRYRMYEGAICIVLAAGFSKVEKDGAAAFVPPFFGASWSMIFWLVVSNMAFIFSRKYMGMSSANHWRTPSFFKQFCREFVWNDDIMEKMAQLFWTFFPSWCFQTGIFSDEAWNLGGAPIFRKKKHTIWLFNSLPWKDPPFLSSVNHLFRLGPSIPWLC